MSRPKGSKCPKHSAWMKENNPSKCPEVIAKRSGPNHCLFGKKKPDFSKWLREDNPMKRPEVAMKSGNSRKGKLTGTSNPNWQGGISKDPYGFDFDKGLKERIRKRDNYQCQECGILEKDLGYTLTVHHIDYNKKNNADLNLISLCKSCNFKANFNREDWTNYFAKSIKNKEEVGRDTSNDLLM